MKTQNVFVGWYKEQTLTEKWNFAADKITGDITLFAKWQELYVIDSIYFGSYPQSDVTAEMSGVVPALQIKI